MQYSFGPLSISITFSFGNLTTIASPCPTSTHAVITSTSYFSSNNLTQTEVRKALAIFLFKGEDVNKEIATLSGGERARVALLMIMLSESNFLILDEPAAALDLVAKNIIHTYLASFKESGGGICIATHDEEELDLCDKIYVLKNKSLHEIDKNIRGNLLINEIMA